MIRTVGRSVEAALRLLVKGWLPRVRYAGEESGYYRFAVPSESGRDAYTVCVRVAEPTLRCSCPAGLHGKACKHVALLRLQFGWVAGER